MERKNNKENIIVGIIIFIFVVLTIVWFANYSSETPKDENVGNGLAAITLNTNDSLEKKPYVNTRDGFSLNLITGWQAKETGDPRCPIMFSKANIVIPNICAIVKEMPAELKKVTLDQYVGLTKSELASSTIVQYKLLNDQAVVLNKIPGRILDITFTPKTRVVRSLQLYVLNNNKLYLLTATFYQSDSILGEIIKSSFLSFKIN